MKKMKKLDYGNSYRVINYGERWYAERLDRPGVWKILGEFGSKERADKEVSNYVKGQR